MDRELEPQTEEKSEYEPITAKKKKSGKKIGVFFGGMACGMVLCLLLFGIVIIAKNVFFLLEVKKAQLG